MGVMLAICSLSFTAFAIPREELGDRMSIVLTLLLTAVAFKLVIADALPKVSYFTALDKYMNAMFALLFIVAVENGISAELTRMNVYITGIESFTFGLVAVFFFVFHVWYMWQVAGYKRAGRALLKGARRAGEAHHSKVAAMVSKR